MTERERGKIGDDDSRTPDFTDFTPRKQPPTASSEPTGQTAKDAGFTTRHAAPPAAKVDGRSLRVTKRTTQLNIAVSVDTKDRFWTLAQAAGVQAGEDFLIRLMDGFIGREL